MIKYTDFFFSKFSIFLTNHNRFFQSLHFPELGSILSPILVVQRWSCKNIAPVIATKSAPPPAAAAATLAPHSMWPSGGVGRGKRNCQLLKHDIRSCNAPGRLLARLSQQWNIGKYSYRAGPGQSVGFHQEKKKCGTAIDSPNSVREIQFICNEL